MEKEGTTTVVELNENFFDQFVSDNIPVKLVATFAEKIRYRLTYDTTLTHGYTYDGPELQDVIRYSTDGNFDTPIYISNDIDTDFCVYKENYRYKRKFLYFSDGSNHYNPGDQINNATNFGHTTHTLTLRLIFDEEIQSSSVTLKKYESGSVQTTTICKDNPNATTIFNEFINSIDYDNFINDGEDIYGYNTFYTHYWNYSSHAYKWDERDQNLLDADRKSKDDVVTEFNNWQAGPDSNYTYDYGVNYKIVNENDVIILSEPTNITYDIGETVNASGLVARFRYWNHPEEEFSYDAIPELFRFDPELSSFGYNIVHDEPVSVYVKNYTNDALRFNITVDASGDGAYLLLNHGATFDNGGLAIKYETEDDFTNAKATGVNINVEEGYQNLNRWTSDGTTYHDSLNDFDWDGTGSIIIRNNISTTVSFNCDTEKGSIASQKLVFNDEEGVLFDATDFTVTPTIRWTFNGYKKNDGTDLIQVADIDWANSYDADAPVVYTADFSYKTINTIDVLTKPSKITYIEGDTFNPSGLVIKVTYEGGVTETVTYNNSVNDFETITTTLLPGVDVARMKFLNKEFTIPITVNRKKASSISINTKPAKLIYEETEKLDVAGLVINVVYNNGTRVTVAYSGNENQFSFNPNLTQSLTTSHKNVEVTYDNCKARFDITVNQKTPDPDPDPDPKPTPTPTPTPPSGGGGSSGGGDSANLVVGPLVNSIHTLRVNEVKTIKGVLNSDLGSWRYDPVNDKWKFSAVNNEGISVDAINGFYVLTKTNHQLINGINNDTVANITYYFDASGNMMTGYIITADAKTYYFETIKTNAEGMMVAGWKEILGSWYFFGADGAMLINTLTHDGYMVGADGKYIQ